MMIPALRTVLDRIEAWPPERQERAAAILTTLEGEEREVAGSGSDDYVISDADCAEIRRRMSAPQVRLGLDELKMRLGRLLV